MILKDMSTSFHRTIPLVLWLVQCLIASTDAGLASNRAGAGLRHHVTATTVTINNQTFSTTDRNTDVIMSANNNLFTSPGRHETIEVGPFVWSASKQAWVAIHDTSTTTTTTTTTIQPDKKNIITAPEFECPEGEELEDGVCREDWGRMLDPVSNSGTNKTNSSLNSTISPVHRCPVGQVVDPQGQCRDNRGRVVTPGHNCSVGHVVDSQGQCRDNRGRVVTPVQHCPVGQVTDPQGQCRDNRGRFVTPAPEGRRRGLS